MKSSKSFPPLDIIQQGVPDLGLLLADDIWRHFVIPRFTYNFTISPDSETEFEFAK